jgi:transducin (beta)-like 1
VLSHQDQDGEPRDITSLRWSPQGNALATGSYSGDLRFWSPEGDLLSVTRAHKGPVFSLKWNHQGTYLVTGGVDKIITVWDPVSFQPLHRYECHTQPVLEIDWRDDEVFASSSADKTIQVCRVGETEPIKKFEGHRLDVNEVGWSPDGKFVASCSDDTTAKIWSLESDRFVHDLRGHEKEVFSLEWSPTGPGSDNPNLDLVLAT